MKRRADILFGCVVLLLGALAALAVPTLPLRTWLPAPVLALVMAFVTARNHASVRAALTAWVLFFLATSILLSNFSSPLPAASLVVSGVLLGPSALRGLRRMLAGPQAADLAIATGVALVGWCAAASAFATRSQTGAHQLIPFIQILVIALLAWLVAREASADIRPSVLRGVTVFSLLLVTSAGLLAVAGWRTAARRAEQAERAGDHVGAFDYARQEEARSRALGLPGAVVTALRRQARSAQAMGQDGVWREKMQEITHVNPNDEQAWAELLTDSLQAGDPGRTLGAFMRVTLPRLSSKDVSQIAILAAQSTNLQALTRAWRLGADPQLVIKSAAIDSAGVGKQLYFANESAIAEPFLKNALIRTPDDWQSRSLLASLYLDTDQPERAISLVQSVEDMTSAQFIDLRNFVAAASNEIKTNAAGLLQIGPALQLTECKISTSEANAGAAIQLNCRWNSRRPVNPAWRVFVHVREMVYGGTLFQGDHTFQTVGEDAANWPAGTPLSYTLDIPVPTDAPPGVYRVLLGVWDGVQRLPVHGPQHVDNMKVINGDQVLVGEVTILHH